MRHTTTAAGLILIALFAALGPALALAAGKPVNLLLNGGAEQGKGKLPSIWFAAKVPAKGLRMFRSAGQFKTGSASFAIFNEHEYAEAVANNWAQRLQSFPAGKSLRLSAFVRTADADAANVCLQCWAAGGKEMLAFASTPVITERCRLGRYKKSMQHRGPMPPAT